jgi:hypothetical protein
MTLDQILAEQNKGIAITTATKEKAGVFGVAAISSGASSSGTSSSGAQGTIAGVGMGNFAPSGASAEVKALGRSAGIRMPKISNPPGNCANAESAGNAIKVKKEPGADRVPKDQAKVKNPKAKAAKAKVAAGRKLQGGRGRKKEDRVEKTNDIISKFEHGKFEHSDYWANWKTHEKVLKATKEDVKTELDRMVELKTRLDDMDDQEGEADDEEENFDANRLELLQLTHKKLHIVHKIVSTYGRLGGYCDEFMTSFTECEEFGKLDPIVNIAVPAFLLKQRYEVWCLNAEPKKFFDFLKPKDLKENGFEGKTLADGDTDEDKLFDEVQGNLVCQKIVSITSRAKDGKTAMRALAGYFGAAMEKDGWGTLLDLSVKQLKVVGEFFEFPAETDRSLEAMEAATKATGDKANAILNELNQSSNGRWIVTRLKNIITEKKKCDMDINKVLGFKKSLGDHLGELAKEGNNVNVQSVAGSYILQIYDLVSGMGERERKKACGELDEKHFHQCLANVLANPKDIKKGMGSDELNGLEKFAIELYKECKFYVYAVSARQIANFLTEHAKIQAITSLDTDDELLNYITKASKFNDAKVDVPQDIDNATEVMEEVAALKKAIATQDNPLFKKAVQVYVKSMDSKMQPSLEAMEKAGFDLKNLDNILDDRFSALAEPTRLEALSSATKEALCKKHRDRCRFMQLTVATVGWCSEMNKKRVGLTTNADLGSNPADAKRVIEISNSVGLLKAMQPDLDALFKPDADDGGNLVQWETLDDKGILLDSMSIGNKVVMKAQSFVNDIKTQWLEIAKKTSETVDSMVPNEVSWDAKTLLDQDQESGRMAILKNQKFELLTHTVPLLAATVKDLKALNIGSLYGPLVDCAALKALETTESYGYKVLAFTYALFQLFRKIPKDVDLQLRKGKLEKLRTEMRDRSYPLPPEWNGSLENIEDGRKPWEQDMDYIRCTTGCALPLFSRRKS